MSNARDKANIPALNFSSTGIDDNASSTAVTIDSSGDVGINNTAPNLNPWNKAVTLSGTNNCAYELAKGSTLHGAFGLQGDNRVQLINFQSADITFNTTSSALQRMRIKSGGDVYFYEDTGTTPKMIWDASAESLSIGSSNNPDENLHIQTSDSTAGTIKLERGTSGVGTGDAVGELKFATNDGSYTATTSTDEVAKISAVSPNSFGDRYDLAFYTGIYNESTPGERLRITNNGRVGINTSSPNQDLSISNSGDTGLELLSGTSSIGKLLFSDSGYGGIGNIQYSHSDNSMRFETNTSEAMRIDSTGNLNINTTTKLTDASISSGATGISLRGDADVALISRDGGYGLVINRKTSDGELMQLRKDGTTVGSLETEAVGGSGRLIVKSTTFDGFLDRAGTTIAKWMVSSFTPGADNTFDLGRSSERWDDVFATNGTIQTSDQNEKQSIQSLTSSEMNVGKRLSPLIKTFKWNSSVEEKGDNARTHTGIIAQDVQQAFTDEGLDASNYALFTSDTWWEKEISVEATEEKDAYTYMDYKEEATDGYTERTRLGVRYPQLLSFIQAYNDQRFTELEARITALETNQP